MARGRPSAASSATPASTRNASANASLTRSGRSSRSGRASGTPSVTAGVASDLTSAALGRGRGRPRKVSVMGSESVSSVPTPLDSSSEAEYSTPGTSKVATPTAPDVSTGKPRSSIQVQLPARIEPDISNAERGLRKSAYALNSRSKRRSLLVADSEEEDDFSDTSPDAQVARRLQEEEYVKQEDDALPARPVRRSGRQSNAVVFSSPATLPKQTLKRGRPSTDSVVATRPPAKKTKGASKIDLDAEIAAAAEYDSDESMAAFVSDDEAFKDEGEEDDEADELQQSSDDEPLSRSTRKANMRNKKASVQPRKPAAKPRLAAKPPRRARASQGAAPKQEEKPLAIPDSDPEAELDDIYAATDDESALSSLANGLSTSGSDSEAVPANNDIRRATNQRRAFRRTGNNRRLRKERDRLEANHPEIKTMWTDLEKMPVLKAGKAAQPASISRFLKPFQLEGLAWLIEMEKREWKGGLLGDEMGLGKTIQAVSLIMSDYPAKTPSLVLVPPVALMQWQSEIKSYTDGTLKTFVYHGTNQKTKGMTVKDLRKYDVIMMSYNSLESIYRKQEKGFTRKDGVHKEKSIIHAITFHRVILDEAHSIKTRTTMTAKACFALKTDYRWCLTGTPLQNRIGEFFSLIRFLNIRPFASYLCKQCPCSQLEWSMGEDSRCSSCGHAGMQHVSVFNQELLNPIQKFGNMGPGREAFSKLRLMTERIMLRRLKKDHTNSMELPVKEIYVDRQFFGEEENDFANSIMTSGQRKFDTYVAQGVLLNNYANIFGLIMQMRQVADHPDLITKKNADGGQNVLVCCICDEPSEDTVRSRCKHDFCRTCVASYIHSTDEPDCPRCHIPLSIDLEQPEIEQDETLMKKSSIINRIKMENWTSSSKIELLVHELHKLRSDNASHKSIIFSQFTTMLQLIEWRLRRAGITTVMLDGSMTPAQRQASIEHFMTNVNVECFLVSLKAGGVALNLTEASRVFIVDPWWNPAAEWQSADRCHRIGQTRPCTITRLCIEDSVESRMVLIQEKKTNMINSTVNADDKAMESLTPEDMQFLFRGS